MKSKDLSDSKEMYELIKFRDFLTGVGMNYKAIFNIWRVKWKFETSFKILDKHIKF